MIFVCQEEYIQRRQVEKIKLGFKLFCVLAEKNHISPKDTKLLVLLLKEVDKTHLLEEATLAARPQPTHKCTPPSASVEYSVYLDKRFWSFLKDLAKRLPESDFHNLALHFQTTPFLIGHREVKQPTFSRESSP